ncbi:MAG: hypothetical protein PF445_08015 [Melioribacteraceae bacterium]|jgi:hypothetical protein|nr:hypothetical protein [Melioribacteraceae bacterium]
MELEKQIRMEADEILYYKGLLKLLNQFGRAEVTGSYQLQLMCKKDLDIGLVNSNLQPVQFFELGSKIVKLLKPHSVFYRNTRIKAVKNRPTDALYFGVLFKDWKIDLWVISEEWATESQKYIDSIIGKLSKEKKEIILKIKEYYLNSPQYGRSFSSKEVYSSVLDNNIPTIEEFRRVIERK